MDDYDLLTDDEADEILAELLYVQERDLFSHRTNRERYISLLADESIKQSPQFVSRLQNLLEQTDARILEVESIRNAIKPQLPDRTRLLSAYARVKDRNSSLRPDQPRV